MSDYMMDGWVPEDDKAEHWSYEDKLKPLLVESASVSGDVDLRPFTSPRHSQGATGSCVANATIKALEIKRIQKYGHEAHVDLSRLAVYYLSRELMFPPRTNTDKGTFVSLAFDVLRRFGVCPEADWPFDISKVNVPPSWKAMRAAYQHKIAAYYKIRSEGNDRIDEVIRCLRAGNPVVFGTRTGMNWSSYRKGEVLTVPLIRTGAHATVLVGFQDGKFIGENSWGCYDDQTEILTSEGWRLFEHLRADDVFATLNPETHELEYQTASKIHDYDYEGGLLHFQKQGIDLLVTPNHRMYVTHHRKRHLPNWPIVRADSLDGSRRVCFKKDACNTAADVLYFDVAGEKVDADSWLEFLGYFLSEGSTTKRSALRTRNRVRLYTQKGGVTREGATGRFLSNPNAVPGVATCSYAETYTETYRQVSLSQALGEDADRIASCLGKLPWHFSESVKPGKGTRKPQKTWTNTTKGLFDHLFAQGKALDKHIPREYLRLSLRQSRILLDALMLGDGSVSSSWVYYTSSQRLADDVQELSLRCGYAADISTVDRRATHNTTGPEYQIGIKRVRVRPEACHVPVKVPYKGKVYCVTVPNGLVYVRRQGQAVWCGNSSWGDDGFYLMAPEVIASDKSQDFWVCSAPWEATP